MDIYFDFLGAELLGHGISEGLSLVVVPFYALITVV